MNNYFINPNKKMKKNQKLGEHETEILKAVAQAWHSHSSSSKAAATTTSEFDTHRRCFNGKPSRFKIEAMKMTIKKDQFGRSWDFGQSLWDSYEILSVSKKLETGLVMDNPLPTLDERAGRKRRESKNSLRNLFNKMSSRRFTEEEIP